MDNAFSTMARDASPQKAGSSCVLHHGKTRLSVCCSLLDALPRLQVLVFKGQLPGACTMCCGSCEGAPELLDEGEKALHAAGCERLAKQLLACA